MQPLQIFRAGKHQAMSGAVVEFSASDVQDLVDSYDPEIRKAPFVKGHPKLDAPAFGWAGALGLADGDIVEVTESQQVDEAFAADVNAGKFKYISASIFQPDAPGNPKPGHYYLKHIGFLGAAAPAVSGLKEASFAALADPEDGVESFAMHIGPIVASQGRMLAGIFNRFRDWLLEREGSEVADKVLPRIEIDWLREDAAMAMVDDQTDQDPESPPMGFASPDASTTPKEDPGMSDKTPTGGSGADDFAAREAALNDRENELKAREEDIAAREAAARQKAHEDFAQAQADAGRYPKARAPQVAAILTALEGGEDLEFSSGEGKTTTQSPVEAFKAFIENLPRLDFSEKTGEGGEPLDHPDTIRQAHIAGESVDFAAVEKTIKAYMSEHDVSREQAIEALGDKLPG